MMSVAIVFPAAVGSFGLFWCGTDYGETGSCRDRTDGSDVAFDYFPAVNLDDTHPLSYFNPVNFASNHPEFVDIIQSEALKAYQTAFGTFGITVPKGSTTLKNGMREECASYFNLAYSDFAAMSTGMSGSASFQTAKKS